MVRLPICGLGLLASLALVVSCSGTGNTPCTDGIDNDNDGLIDGLDPGCDHNGGLAESPEPPKPACSDGVDNDGDGKFDFPADPGCSGPTDDDETDPPLPPPECNDGVDNNGNGVIDYPNDPGCTSLTDEDEDDNPPVTACSDGVDNDGDGKTDYPEDPGCTDAADGSEVDPFVTECGTNLAITDFPASSVIEGDIASGGDNQLVGECGGLGAEAVWKLTLAEPASLLFTVDTATNLSFSLYLRRECRSPDTELACLTLGPADSGTVQVVPTVAAGDYYLVVDAADATSTGHFKVMVERRVPAGAPCVVGGDPCAPGYYCRLLYTDSTETTCERHGCADSVDNDYDGRTDYPDEPGCSSADDDDETDPATAPACADGVDNDGDGATDYPDDPGCYAASDDREQDVCTPGVELYDLTDAGATGTTSGSSNFSASCASTTAAPEVVYRYKLARSLTELSFSSAGSAFDTVLYARQGTCGTGTILACRNDFGAETLTLTDPAAGDYFLFVDGVSGASGAFQISVAGEVAEHGACVAGSTQFPCAAGLLCKGATPTCERPLCSNGADDDADGKTDFPWDPGCVSALDDNEVDPGTLPLCADGVDNDADGKIDFPTDPGCGSAADDGEANECSAGVGFTILPMSAPEVTGTTSGTSTFTGTCANTTPAPEAVYAFEVSGPMKSLTFKTDGSGYDTVLYVRGRDCGGGPELACSDPGTVTLTDPAPGWYFAFVDGYWNASGTYKLAASGVVDAGGACDPAWTAFTCASGTVCRAASKKCEAMRCNDGIDNDGDGKADDMDPGCDSALDDDETDPAVTPQCADGSDNDGDGQVDYPADPGCQRASDNDERDCEDPDPLTDVTYQATTTGTTATASDNLSGSCGGSGGLELPHMLVVPGMLSTLTLTTDGSLFDTVLYVMAGSCTGTDLECDDDGGAGTQSLIEMTDVPAGRYFIFVDGYSSSANGTYTLSVHGTVKDGERCDPAQITAGVTECNTGKNCVDLGDGARCQ